MMFEKVQAKFLAATIEYAQENIRREDQKGLAIDGRINHSILSELFSNERIGAIFICGDWFFAKSVTFFEFGVEKVRFTFKNRSFLVLITRFRTANLE